MFTAKNLKVIKFSKKKKTQTYEDRIVELNKISDNALLHNAHMYINNIKYSMLAQEKLNIQIMNYNKINQEKLNLETKTYMSILLKVNVPNDIKILH